MATIEEQIIALLEGIVTVPVSLEEPANPDYGDYSTNVAMQLFKNPEVRGDAKNPRELAQSIADTLIAKKPDFFADVSIAGPGFINFKLSEPYLLTHFELPQPTPIGKKAIIEYMQPNTNKPLHVGHLRNAILGKALIELKKATGWDVKAATVNNDRGLHITKSMWAYLTMGEHTHTDTSWQEKLHNWKSSPSKWVSPTEMDDPKFHKGDFFVGYWYTKADTFAEDETVQKEWQAMLLAWENKEDTEHSNVRALWEAMNNWFYEGAKESYDVLGVQFDADQISYESNIYEAGKQIILKNVINGVFEKLPDGAIRANLQEKANLPDKILLRKDGTGIYMTFDIELTRERSEQGADLLVWVVGNDQNLYFQQLFAVCELLGYGTKDLFHHFSYGMVRLPEGKMSSRKGTVIYSDDVIEVSIEKALEVMKHAGVGKDLSEKEQQEVAKEVGIGAVKYTMLSYDPDSQIAFDLEKSVTFEGDSGPYLQYAYARACSILSKVEKNHTNSTNDVLNKSELALIHKLQKYNWTLKRSSDAYGPHLLCTYLLELSQVFNRFYAESNPILGNATREQLTREFQETLRHGLTILGIAAPEKM